MSSPRYRPPTIELASFVRPLPSQSARSAIRSRTIQPMLCRVFAYCDPGFPRPTTIFTKPPVALAGTWRSGGEHADRAQIPSGWARIAMVASAAELGGRFVADASLATGEAGQDRALDCPHRRFLGRCRMVPAADVKRPVDGKEQDFV